MDFETFDARLDDLVVPAKTAPRFLIYHYTTTAGFEGILRSGEFWATHFQDTNDTTELRHADERVLLVVTRLARSGSVLTRRLLNRFLAEYESKSFAKHVTSYLTCFSEDAALLKQWVHYADDGFGCAVGFLPAGDSSNPTACNPGLAVELFRVEYDLNILEREFEGAVAEMLGFVEQLGGATALQPHFENRFVAALLRRAAYASVRSKHPSFGEEMEWRLLVFPAPDSAVTELVREIRGVKRRYVKVRINTEDASLPITKVVVGPSHVALQTDETAVRNADELLRRFNGRGPSCRVEVCPIPYRGSR